MKPNILWLTLLSLIAVSQARAETLCIPIDGYGTERCESGLLSDVIDDTFANSGTGTIQERQNWCWAAAISMAFAQAGYKVPQEQIVKETIGSVRDVRGQGYQMHGALSRRWTDVNGKNFDVTARVFDITSQRADVSNATIVRELHNNRPVIYGALGHATLLTSVTYIKHRSGNVQVLGATVRDPWPGNGRRVLSAAEMMNPMFAAAINITDRGVGRTSDSCSWVAALHASVADGYSQHRGEASKNGERYMGKIRFPGTEECRMTFIRRDPNRPRYYCDSNPMSKTAAVAAAKSAANQLDKCLSSWRITEDEDRAFFKQWVTEGFGVNITVSQHDGKWEWEVAAFVPVK